MKKIITFITIIALLAVPLTSCTPQQMARDFGGKVTINVPKGQKVTSATWKEADLFYFLEPMEPGYAPQQKQFIESSSYGMWETQVIFVESR